MPNQEPTDESRKDNTSCVLNVSAVLFCLFLCVTISVSNGISTILFYRMVGQLYPVSISGGFNNSIGHDISNSNSYALNDKREVHFLLVWAIILSLAFPQIYTILSCVWIKCHKRSGSKKNNGSEDENVNEDNNNNQDKHRRCKDWVLMIFVGIKSAIWTVFTFCFLTRVDAMTGFSTVLLLQSSLIMSRQFINKDVDRTCDNFIRISACVMCWVSFAAIVLIHLVYSTIGTTDIVATVFALLSLIVTVIEVVVPPCACENRVAPFTDYLFDQSQSSTLRKNRETFYIVQSVVQLIVIVFFAVTASTVFCDKPFGIFGSPYTMKCRYGDYDSYLTWDGDATEAILSVFMFISFSLVCFKLCYYACAINTQVIFCYVPLFLSTFLTVVSMLCFSFFETTISGSIILPYKFKDEIEISVQLSVPVVTSFVALLCVFLLVVNHRKNLAKRMEEQESLFQYPYYQSVGIGISIVHSRVSNMSNLVQNRADNPSSKNNTRKKHVYVCSTMMHEKGKEMKRLVSSILRLQRISSDECTYEAHIIFDNAFEEDQPNKYVRRLEKVIEGDLHENSRDLQENSSQSQQNTDNSWYQKIEYPTPYGCKYEYIKNNGEDENVPLISVHLKDKRKIRMKKRWSQVMYMFFFLRFKQKDNLRNSFILTLDGDVDFEPKAVERLKELLDRDDNVGAACGRIFPEGIGPMIWYQKFEYAASHWLQKSTEHVFGCCLCSPGCFSLFRGDALNEVLNTYTQRAEKSLHHIQYDLGEDRWLCTLLLKNGYKVEYMSAATAKTFAPQSFLEFCKQRRRWTPSTLANILDVIWLHSKEVRKNNPYINKLYLLYQTYLLVSSIVTPGTIFLVILGALVKAFPELPLWVALLLNVVPIAVLMIICIMTDKDEIPIYYSGILSTVYSLLMIVLLIGLIIEAKQSDFCSISTFFFAFVVGVFFLSALLHPAEFKYLFYGAMYFFAVPAVSMILVIYILGSLHILRWGTREKRSDYVTDDDKLSFLDRCCGRQRDERGADEFLLLCNESKPSVGGKIEIKCNRRVPPNCNVVWKKDARDINNNDRRIDMCNYGFPKLVINNAKISDSGSYSCDVIQISGGHIEFKPCNVAVKGKKGREAVRLITASGSDTIVEGHEDAIVCKVSHNIKNKTIWKKDSTIIDEQFISNNKYTITNATKSAAGTYSCEVIFDTTDDSITIRRSKVENRENCIIIKPRRQEENSNGRSVVWKIDDTAIEQSEDSVEIDNENNLKLDTTNWKKDKFNVSRTVKSNQLNITDKFEVCKKNGEFTIKNKSYKRILKSTGTMFIDSEITWKENEISIEDIPEPVQQQKKKTGTVTITEPNKKERTYTCSIKHQPKSDSIAVDIVKPTLVMEGPDMILLKSNKTVEIKCRSTANGFTNVEWKKDNVEKTENTDHFQREKTHIFTLKINKASKTDAGRYTCKVKTNMGTVLEASKSIGCELDDEEQNEWDKLIKEHLSPDEESFEKQKEVHEQMLSLRNNVYFLFFLINALFVTSIFMMTQVNEFKGNIQISIPCPNKDGMFQVEPISMIFIFTFGLTLVFQMVGMVIHRFNTFLHLAYDIFSRKDAGRADQHENA